MNTESQIAWHLVLLRNVVILLTAFFVLCHAYSYFQSGSIDIFTAFVVITTGAAISYVIHWVNLKIHGFSKLDQLKVSAE